MNGVLRSWSWVAHQITVQSFSNLLRFCICGSCLSSLQHETLLRVACMLLKDGRTSLRLLHKNRKIEKKLFPNDSYSIQNNVQATRTKKACGELPQKHGRHSGRTASILGCLSPPHDDSDKDLHCISLVLSSCQRTKLVHS